MAPCSQTQRPTRSSSDLRAVLNEICWDRLERVVPYDSRACGHERPDSYYDIAVFIEDPGRLGDELHRLALVTTDMLLDTGAVISTLPFRAGAYRDLHFATETYRSVRSQFNRLARQEPGIEREFLTFLGQGYEFRTPTAINNISPDDAASAVDTAGRFIDVITELLAAEVRCA